MVIKDKLHVYTEIMSGSGIIRVIKFRKIIIKNVWEFMIKLVKTRMDKEHEE